MNTTLPPARDLPPHRHARIRAALVRAPSEPRQAVRLVPIAATVVAVAGLVAGAVWLAPGDSGTRAADQPTTSSSTAPSGPVPTSPDDLIARFRVVLGDTATFEVTEKTTVPGTSPSKNQQPTVSVLTPQPGDPY